MVVNVRITQTDVDIHHWATREGLSRETADILEDQGFRTVNDLKDLSPDDVIDIFQTTGLLKGKECFDLKKAIGRLSRDLEQLSMGREDIHHWATREGLSRETADILEDQGFRTVNDLKDLSPDDVIDIFQRSRLLKGKECFDLKKAIGRLSRELEQLSMGREDIHHWATREGLSKKTADILEDQGFRTVNDLKDLSPDDVIDIFQRSRLLKGKECLDLKKATGRLSRELEPLSMGREVPSIFTDDLVEVTGLRPGQLKSIRPKFEPREKMKVYNPVTGAAGGQVAAASKPLLSSPFGSSDNEPSQVAAAFKPLPSSAFGSSMNEPSQVAAAFKPLPSSPFRSSMNEPKEEFRFLMLGKTASGKSTTGNTILGEDKFPTSVGSSSVTTDFELHKTNKRGRLIEIMDCPGLCNTSKSQTEVAISIMQAVSCMHPGPHAILYICRLGRYTAEDFGIFQILKALFGVHVTDYMIVLFTGGDDLEREKTTLADLLTHAPKDLLQVIKECGHRCHVLNNTAKNKKPQVDKLLEEVRNIKIANGDHPHYHCPKYTTPGENVEAEVERRLADVTKRDPEKAQYIQDLEAQTKKATEAAEKLKADMARNEKERMWRKSARK